VTTCEVYRNPCEVKVYFWGAEMKIKLFTIEPYIKGRKIFSVFMQNTILLSLVYT
jgi:hypothetical protein